MRLIARPKVLPSVTAARVPSPAPGLPVATNFLPRPPLICTRYHPRHRPTRSTAPRSLSAPARAQATHARAYTYLPLTAMAVWISYPLA